MAAFPVNITSLHLTPLTAECTCNYPCQLEPLYVSLGRWQVCTDEPVIGVKAES